MVPYCAADILVDRDGMSLYVCVLPLISLYNSLLPFCVSINLLWTSRICDKVCTVYFWTVFITVLFTSFFQKSTEAKFPLPIKSAEGKLYSQWEQTRAGNGSPCHHTDILLRETDGYNGRLEGGSIGVPKDDRPGIHVLGSGEDRAPLLLRRGQRAEGGH